MTDNNSHNFEKLTQALDEMKNLGNFNGILLADRNGALITENIDKKSNYSEFAAMCASVLKSAESLGQSIGGKTEKIITELDEQIIVIIECDSKGFLAFLIKSESNSEIIFNNVEEFGKKIKFLL